MRDTERVPDDNVGVVDGCVGVRGNPLGKAARGFAGGLRDMSAGGVELVVLVCSLLVTRMYRRERIWEGGKRGEIHLVTWMA